MEKANQTPLLKCVEYLENLKRMATKPPEKTAPSIQESLKEMSQKYKERYFQKHQSQVLGKRKFNVFSQSQSVCEFKMCSEQGKRSLSPSIFTKRGGSHEKHKIHRGRPSANLPPNIKHQEAPGITHQITPKEQISGISKGLENYLEFVSFSYYGGSARPKENEGLGKQRRNLHFTTLDRLVSPLRKDLVFELWAPKQIALFESGICTYGKDFHSIKQLIAGKSVNDIVEFYYFWKKTSHYKIWKIKAKELREHEQNKWIFL